MSRKANIISYIITMAATLGTLFAAVYVCDVRYGGTMFSAVLKFIVGAIIAGLIHTFAHELGHLVAGKNNDFKFSSMTVWFFKWSRVRKKIRFDFVMMGEEAGYTEMIPTCSENMAKRLKKNDHGRNMGVINFYDYRCTSVICGGASSLGLFYTRYVFACRCVFLFRQFIAFFDGWSKK